MGCALRGEKNPFLYFSPLPRGFFNIFQELVSIEIKPLLSDNCVYYATVRAPQ